MAYSPAWLNAADSGARNQGGTQVGATCGLFAVNHIMACAASLADGEPDLYDKEAFEHHALAVGIADSPENLIGKLRLGGPPRES